MSRVSVGENIAAITFKSDGIQPPSDLYMTRDDALFVTSYNSASSLAVHVRYTMLRLDGVVVAGAIDTHVPNTDRTAKTTVQKLGEGFLLNASVFLGSGAARRGQCFVQVGVARGVDTSRFVHRIILQGYVGTAVNLAWPGNRLEQPTEGPGAIRSITGTDPAAGAQITEAVPTGARWRLLSFYALLATDANVANRQAAVTYDDGTNPLFHSPQAFLQTAGTSASYAWGIGMPIAVVIASAGPLAGLPTEVRLEAAFRVKTSIVNGQVGDNWAAPQYVVEEWIQP